MPLPLIKAFDDLYAQIPSIECKGLCHTSCSLVPMSSFEWGRLVIRHGKVPGIREIDPADGKPWCPLLTADKACEHYDIRPALCRLWGVVDSDLMRCVYGCKPVKYLTEQEGLDILARANAMGGGESFGQMNVIVAPEGKIIKGRAKVQK